MSHRESYQSIIEYINAATDAEAPKVVAARELVAQYEASVLNECSNTKFQIEAFGFFLKDLTREQILQAIQHRPWLHKHEILTRWAWMCSQNKCINNGVIFNNPFSCEVGPRINRRTIDREFETLRMFLPLYRKHTSRKLLFVEKLENPNDPPDFKVEDKKGNVLGIEVTEVPLSKHINKQEDARQKIFEQLHKDLYTKQCVLHFKTYPRWSYLYSLYDGLKEWLYPLFNSGTSCIESENQEIGISIIIKKSSDSFTITYSSDCRGVGYSGDKIEGMISKSILRMLNQKANKNKQPSVTPCILVMYENCLPMGDYDKIVELVRQNASNTWEKKFAEVWLTSYKKCVPLLN